MFLLLGCILFSAFMQISCGADNVPHFMNDSALVRVKRQTFYYLCGSPPTQYYSVKPCTPTAPKCQNGGRLIGVGCRSVYRVVAAPCRNHRCRRRSHQYPGTDSAFVTTVNSRKCDATSQDNVLRARRASTDCAAHQPEMNINTLAGEKLP
ncbi:unnamed protein product, partial [Mesorhabditis spiculigera]